MGINDRIDDSSNQDEAGDKDLKEIHRTTASYGKETLRSFCDGCCDIKKRLKLRESSHLLDQIEH